MPRPEQDIKQAWFPGVHCDVGGGYIEADSGLSKIALAWMVGEAGSRLAFRESAVLQLLPQHDTAEYAAPNVEAQIHHSLRGLWWLVEVMPKRVKDPSRNFAPRWTIPFGRYRFVRNTGRYI